MTLLPSALRLAELGWPVFALNPGGLPWPNCQECSNSRCPAPSYRECTHLTCHAVWSATTESAALDEMWSQRPDSLIGLHVGAAGLIILDVDQHSSDKDGKAALLDLIERGYITDTVRANTGGGGMHLYYVNPGDRTVRNDNRGRVAPGIDVKSTGGYALVPPSAKVGKPGYSWVAGKSPWDRPVADMHPELLSRIVAAPEESPTGGFSVDLTRYSPKDLQRALRRLVDTGQGSRNHRLYVAARRAAEAVAAGVLGMDEALEQLTEAGLETGLNPREVRSTVLSGLRG